MLSPSAGGPDGDSATGGANKAGKQVLAERLKSLNVEDILVRRQELEQKKLNQLSLNPFRTDQQKLGYHSRF